MRVESRRDAVMSIGEGSVSKDGAAENSDFSTAAQPATIDNPAGARLSAVLILGANGGIGRALAAEFASHHHNLILAGRNLEDLQGLAVDLNLRYSISAVAVKLDVLNFDGLESALAECISLAGGSLEGVVLCIGYLGNAEAARTDLDESGRILDTNFTGSVLALNIVANHLENQRRGFICGLASVAGDRGRQSNYLYGAAKSGLTTYLQGLRNRLYASGVQVITVKLGYVDTRMVFGKTESRLVAQADAVARSIYRAIRSRRDVIYVPWFWRLIMLTVRAIPDTIFKKLNL